MNFGEIISLREEIIELKKELKEEQEMKKVALNLISKLMDESGKLRRELANQTKERI